MIATAKITGAEFDALPYDEGRKWELLSGDLIEVPSPTPKHQDIVLYMAASLSSYVRRNGTGRVYPDVEFGLSANIRLRPDIAVLLQDNWRNLNDQKSPVSGSPDIAIEVISPSERTSESVRKVQAYLRHGVQEVWQVFPMHSTALIYTSTSPLVLLSPEDSFQSPLLPDWRLPIAEALDS